MALSESIKTKCFNCNLEKPELLKLYFTTYYRNSTSKIETICSEECYEYASKNQRCNGCHNTIYIDYRTEDKEEIEKQMNELYVRHKDGYLYCKDNSHWKFSCHQKKEIEEFFKLDDKNGLNDNELSILEIIKTCINSGILIKVEDFYEKILIKNILNYFHKQSSYLENNIINLDKIINFLKNSYLVIPEPEEMEDKPIQDLGGLGIVNHEDDDEDNEEDDRYFNKYFMHMILEKNIYGMVCKYYKKREIEEIVKWFNLDISEITEKSKLYDYENQDIIIEFLEVLKTKIQNGNTYKLSELIYVLENYNEKIQGINRKIPEIRDKIIGCEYSLKRIQKNIEFPAPLYELIKEGEDYDDYDDDYDSESSHNYKYFDLFMELL